MQLLIACDSVSPAVLYDGNPSFDASITLSDSWTNYKYVDIIFEDSDGVRGSVRASYFSGDKDSNQALCLSTSRVTSSGWYVKARGIVLSGNKITTQTTSAGYSTGEVANGKSTVADYIKIRRVVGWK